MTGSEISFNTLPAGKELPFAHAHKINEEVYIIISGDGMFWLNGERVQVKRGDVLRLDPEVFRSIRASSSEDLGYICIQTTQNSIKQVTRQDGILSDEKPEWE